MGKGRFSFTKAVMGVLTFLGALSIIGEKDALALAAEVPKKTPMWSSDKGFCITNGVVQVKFHEYVDVKSIVGSSYEGSSYEGDKKERYLIVYDDQSKNFIIMSPAKDQDAYPGYYDLHVKYLEGELFRTKVRPPSDSIKEIGNLLDKSTACEELAAKVCDLADEMVKNHSNFDKKILVEVQKAIRGIKGHAIKEGVGGGTETRVNQPGTNTIAVNASILSPTNYSQVR